MNALLRQFEFQEAMKEYGYIVGLLTDIDEI